MKRDERKKALIELFMETGQSHHHAFIETDGADPDWAIWYGKHLKLKLSDFLDSELSAEEITEKLLELDKAYNEKTRSDHWTGFYADEFLKSFAN